MARVLLFGAAWMGCLAALALAVGLAERGEPGPARRIRSAPRLESVTPPPRPPRAGTRYPGWTVTRAYSAHHMMVVEVETDHVTSAAAIAAQVVEPLKQHYDEVLIYVREPWQSADELAARRIQWTPRTGYVESVYRSRP